MSTIDADQIRAYVNKTFVEPARKSGKTEVVIVAGDVHTNLKLENRMPAVCSALDAQKLQDEFGVLLRNRSGPRQSSTVRWRFSIVGKAEQPGISTSFWRMQLHPNDPDRAVANTMKSLGLGYIGLDFANPPGDLTDVSRGALERGHQDYWDFAHSMKVGDKVLIVAHHYPCALVEVTGQYNYIRHPEEELGIWFRHLRRVQVLSYYADYITNPASWEQTKMTDTISVLKTTSGVSYKLIERWVAEVASPAQVG